ncbi:hypothetical protein C9374_006699 [Naegleria lovaniensis]|uniref:Transmembrane protein n=1 Tax=Naegleria lovaniensis TaxID=51637 RepID=A0AA88GHL3_NAELO|nr:uncharacterized protein C9374_006699 [Naegleria lovaniensis]KAG2379582.1 hypothetical protein C9374_006699 [Naegleria lovaniensis]
MSERQQQEEIQIESSFSNQNDSPIATPTHTEDQSTLLSQFITHRSSTTTDSTPSGLSQQQPALLNVSTSTPNNYRKQLYQSCVFTYQLLVIQGIYSYFLDYSIFVLILRLVQSFMYHYSFVYSYGKPTILGRIFKDMTLVKKLILIIITLLPIVYIHVSNYLSNATYYSRVMQVTNNGDSFVLIDFFERDVNRHYSEEPLKIGVFSTKDNSVTVHGTRETRFVENLGETRTQTEGATIQSVDSHTTSNRMFDSHPTLFVIYLCLFDVLFAILQVSYVTSLISLKRKPTQQQQQLVLEENNSTITDMV